VNILYVNKIERNAGWGAECFVNRGFLKLGHQTINLDYKTHQYRLADSLLAVDDFDVFLLQRGDHFPPELIQAIQRPRFFWASELVSRCRDQDRLLKSGLFDHVFVHSQECLKAVTGQGWIKPENVSVLINGFDPELHRLRPAGPKDIEVLFVGGILPRRRKLLDRLKLKFAVTEMAVFGEQLVTAFNRAQIVLNLHAEEYLDTETRIFEALGCGAFVISEKLAGENPFVSGRHLVETEGITEMEQAIEYYLHHQSEREQIAQAGHEEALEKHSYIKRAEYIAGIMAKQGGRFNRKIPAIDIRTVKAYRRWEPALKILNLAGRPGKKIMGKAKSLLSTMFKDKVAA